MKCCELVAEYDTLVVGMASEKFVDGGSAQCLSADDVHGAALRLVDLLVNKAGRTCDQIIIDPGLAPVGADTYGLVNMSLDAMRRIRADAVAPGSSLVGRPDQLLVWRAEGYSRRHRKRLSHAGGRGGVGFRAGESRKTPASARCAGSTLLRRCRRLSNADDRPTANRRKMPAIGRRKRSWSCFDECSCDSRTR